MSDLYSATSTQAIEIRNQENTESGKEENPSPLHLLSLQHPPVHHATAPNYLVLGSDGNLGGYMRSDLLRIDLDINARNGDPAVKIFKLEAGWSIRYRAISAEDIQFNEQM